MFESAVKEEKKNQIDQVNKSKRISIQPITQLKMNPGNSIHYTGTEIPEPTGLNTFHGKGSYPISGATKGAYVRLKNVLSKNNAPVDLNEMSKWKNFSGINLLNDPSRTSSGYTLIRMHAINGRLYGVSEMRNMALGTNKSNNSSGESHLHQVEQPIVDFLTQGAGNVAVDYEVTPVTGPPEYLKVRADTITDTSESANFLSWIKEACPSRYDCKATFYRIRRPDVATDGIKWIPGPTQTDSIPLDIT